MDKIVALLVTITAVVLIAVVVIFNGVSPSVEEKADDVMIDMNALPTGTVNSIDRNQELTDSKY